MVRPNGAPPGGSIWITELVQLTFTVAGGLVMAYLAANLLDPNREDRKRKKRYKDQLMRRIGRNLQLSQMEMLLTDTVVNPRDIDIDEEDIFGMEHILTDMRNKVMRPLKMGELYNTTLWRQPRGVLLHGPPGTGKTMIAKVVAKTCGCFFMSISSSNIMSKWYGDAQKLVRAIFTLAAKLEPCIIFIDEVDAFLMARGGQTEHEATLGIKTEFMQCWEGICTNNGAKTLVMGATNRRYSLDAAVLRRFTMQQEIPLPGKTQRAKIVEGYLRKHMQETACMTCDDANEWPILSPRAVVDGISALEWIANATDQYSGSDLHELCAEAAKYPLADLLDDEESGVDVSPMSPARPVSLADFKEALSVVKPVALEAMMRQQQQVSPEEQLRQMLFAQGLDALLRDFVAGDASGSTSSGAGGDAVGPGANGGVDKKANGGIS